MPEPRLVCFRALQAVLVLATAGACSPAPTNGLTGPDGVVQLQLACGEDISVIESRSAGAQVEYQLPVSAGGRVPVTVTCTPPPGDVFPVGTTRVTCTGRDSAAATAECSFQITVQPASRIAATRFLAFGDSITAGEVTVPVALELNGFPSVLFPLRIVESAAYPSVLLELLKSRYPAQTLTVVNAGKGGEALQIAYPRFVSSLSNVQPEVLLLLMGYNDIGGTPNFQAIDRALSVLRDMVRLAKAQNLRVYVATLTPSIPNRQRSQSEAGIVYFNNGVRVLAGSERVHVVDLYSLALPEINAWIGIDGLHPTEAGYARIADAFYQRLVADLELRTETGLGAAGISAASY